MEISEQNYQKAVAVVWDSTSGSVSNLQRKLGWGYCRAAAAIARMQKEFIVSPMSASGRRDVYPSSIHQLWKDLQTAKSQVVPEGFVLVPKASLKVALSWMDADIDPWQMSSDCFAELYEHKPILEKAMIEAQEQSHE